MNGQSSIRDDAVRTTESPSSTSVPSSSPPYAVHGQRDRAAGEVLRVQTTSRLILAVVLSVLHAAWIARMASPFGTRTGITAVLVILAVYATLVAVIHGVAQRDGGVSPAIVTVTLVGDLALVYAVVAATTLPADYERTLFGVVVLVHVANFSYGRRQAWRVVALGVTGYLTLLAFARSRGLLQDPAEHLLSLAFCTTGMVFIVMQASDIRRRLRTIVALLDRAGGGDFSHTYDAESDRRPDAITRVGRAYNLVRSQLSDMVLTDPLTGCLNRRGFDQAIEREVGRATRSGNNFALLALDLDHFKHVNDTYGHVAGDAVLRSIGALLTRSGRAEDVVARVGGEEFAILLADTSAGGAHLFASRLCALIRSHPFVVADGIAPIRVTTSIGVVAGSPRDTPDFAATLLAHADASLYAAKRAGRDCVREMMTANMPVSSEPSPPLSPSRFPGYLTL